MRIVFLGMAGHFSYMILKELLEARVTLEAIVIPTEPADKIAAPRLLPPAPPAPTDLPILNPYLQPTIIQLAWEQHIPLWQVASLAGPAPLALSKDLQPDLMIVACFPFIIPPAVFKWPQYGCLNLHPSLLPAYRGPTPLFWQARAGERRSGVTLHEVDEGLDTGHIISQLAFDWPEGASLRELEQLGAMAGAHLLIEAIEQLSYGQALPSRPQPTKGSSYFSFPTAADFYIPTSWPAQRAFNFIRAAAADWPLVLELTESSGQKKYVPVQTALAYDPDDSLNSAFMNHHDELWVQFNPGVLRL